MNRTDVGCLSAFPFNNQIVRKAIARPGWRTDQRLASKRPKVGQERAVFTGPLAPRADISAMDQTRTIDNHNRDNVRQIQSSERLGSVGND
jgi:hypothetical protein